VRPRDKARRRQRRWRRRRRQRGRKENSFWRHAVILPPEAAERKASERNSISRSQFGARCHLDPKRHLLTAPPREERKIRPLPSLLNRPLGHLTSPATTERQQTDSFLSAASVATHIDPSKGRDGPDDRFQGREEEMGGRNYILYF